jgi:hypothetical protein
MPSLTVGGSSLIGLSRRVVFGPTNSVLYTDLNADGSGDAAVGIMPGCRG